MRTAKKLGVKTVAVYSEADKDAMHVRMADEAYHIGPAASKESYLRMDKIIDICKKTGAQAVHPGYGFLSENASFAQSLQDANITFIGPPASAIISMGSKSESKDIMLAANVPCVPGYHGSNQDPAFLKEKSAEIGYPVLIKAVKGGGGKGMRIADTEADFDQSLESAKREARNSFGDDQVLVEKYLVEPRHVEVQVFADTLGNAVHLFERDCSVQRRHQKVLEEAPAPGLSEELRAELGAKAVAAAKAVNYVGAGTVEFIMDNRDQKFYFMEMNTRLQVEHPVTEMVTGTDLVQWQLEVAAGNELPVKGQSDLSLDGHAFEARIYAENPRGGFLPDTGPLLHVRTPEISDSVRVETGFGQGDAISVHYDPMISKLVVKGSDRTAALRVLRRALDQYQVVGLHTNIDFVKALASHPAFIRGEVETGFIPKYESDLFPEIPETPSEIFAQAAISIVLEDLKASVANSNMTSLMSPWSTLLSTRPGGAKPTRTVSLQPDTTGSTSTTTVKVTFNPNGSFDVDVFEPQTTTAATIKSVNAPTEIRQSFSNISVQVDPTDSTSLSFQMPTGFSKTSIVPIAAQALADPTEPIRLAVFDPQGNRHALVVPAPGWILEQKGATSSGAGSVKAPMPCKVTSVSVQAGDQVTEGQALVVVEAMKMEMVIKAPKKAKVARVVYNVGDLVAEGKDLVEFEAETEEA